LGSLQNRSAIRRSTEAVPLIRRVTHQSIYDQHVLCIIEGADDAPYERLSELHDLEMGHSQKGKASVGEAEVSRRNGELVAGRLAQLSGLE
jgi:hypothetical protein